MAAMDPSWSCRGDPTNDRRRIRDELTYWNPRSPSRIDPSRCSIQPRGPGTTLDRPVFGRSLPRSRNPASLCADERVPLNVAWLRCGTGFPRGPDRRRWFQTPSFWIRGGLRRNTSPVPLKNRTEMPSGIRPRKFDPRIVPPECVDDAGESPS